MSLDKVLHRQILLLIKLTTTWQDITLNQSILTIEKNHFVRRKCLTLLNKKKVCCQQFLLIVKWQEVYRYDKEKNIDGKGDFALYDSIL